MDRQSPSSKNSHFQNDTKCKTFSCGNKYYKYQSLPLSLALKPTLGTTQKIAIINVGKVGHFFGQLFECAKYGKGKFFIFIFSFLS